MRLEVGSKREEGRFSKYEVRSMNYDLRFSNYEVLVPSDLLSCSLLQPVKKLILGVPTSSAVERYKCGSSAEKGSHGQVVDRMPMNPGKIGSNRRFNDVFLDLGKI